MNKHDWTDKSHTPGPWVNNGGVIGPDGCTSDDAVCIVGVPNQQTPRNVANARLLAEAPAMYGLLQKWRDEFSEKAGCECDNCQMSREIDALLSRLDAQD